MALLIAGCAAQAQPHFRGTAVDLAAPDFTLTSGDGTPWTLSAQQGKVVAIFFGYTHCTDTCPDTLAKLSAAFRHAGATAADAEIAFVTIDPAHDTPARMRAYVKRFSGARIVGLTGTPAQIDAVKNDYHVWSDDKDAHSAFTVLVDRSGRERVLHEDADSQAAFTSDMRTLLE